MDLIKKTCWIFENDEILPISEENDDHSIGQPSGFNCSCVGEN